MNYNWFSHFPTDGHYGYCSSLLFPQWSKKWSFASIFIFLQCSHCPIQFPYLLHPDLGASPERQNKVSADLLFLAKWNKIKSSLRRPIWRELLWVEPVRIINLSRAARKLPRPQWWASQFEMSMAILKAENGAIWICNCNPHSHRQRASCL